MSIEKIITKLRAIFARQRRIAKHFPGDLLPLLSLIVVRNQFPKTDFPSCIEAQLLI